MEVVVTTGAISRAKFQSNHHHKQTNIQCFTGRMPFLSPNQQCQSTEGKISHSMGLLTPSSPGGLPTLSVSLTTLPLPGIGSSKSNRFVSSTRNKWLLWTSSMATWKVEPFRRTGAYSGRMPFAMPPMTPTWLESKSAPWESSSLTTEPRFLLINSQNLIQANPTQTFAVILFTRIQTVTRMALSRAHTYTEAAHTANLLVRNKCRMKHTQCIRMKYTQRCGLCLGPDPTITLTLIQNDPDYHCNLQVSFVAHAPIFQRILSKQVE